MHKSFQRIFLIALAIIGFGVFAKYLAPALLGLLLIAAGAMVIVYLPILIRDLLKSGKKEDENAAWFLILMFGLIVIVILVKY